MEQGKGGEDTASCAMYMLNPSGPRLSCSEREIYADVTGFQAGSAWAAGMPAVIVYKLSLATQVGGLVPPST